MDKIWIVIFWTAALIIIVLVVVLMLIFARKDDYSSDESSDNIWYRNQEEYDDLEKENFGKAGEASVARMLQVISENYKSYVFNNYTFMDEKGHSTNIDHIFICQGGIFIIETKANKGIIYGGENDDFWYAEKEYWQEDKKFNNPIKQNQGHISHLKRMFKNNPPKMYSLIIFTSADSIDNVISDKVSDINSAYNSIIKKINEGIYSIEFVDRVYNELTDIINQYGITIEEHKAYLNRKYNN